METETYKIINEVWKFIKKYILECSRGSEEVWDDIAKESSAIFENTKGKPDYFRDMTLSMVLGATTLLEGLYRANRKDN